MTVWKVVTRKVSGAKSRGALAPASGGVRQPLLERRSCSGVQGGRLSKHDPTWQRIRDLHAKRFGSGDQPISPRRATHTLGNDNDVCSKMMS
jgi:hypothetical protein